MAPAVPGSAPYHEYRRQYREYAFARISEDLRRKSAATASKPSERAKAQRVAENARWKADAIRQAMHANGGLDSLRRWVPEQDLTLYQRELLSSPTRRSPGNARENPPSHAGRPAGEGAARSSGGEQPHAAPANEPSSAQPSTSRPRQATSLSRSDLSAGHVSLHSDHPPGTCHCTLTAPPSMCHCTLEVSASAHLRRVRRRRGARPYIRRLTPAACCKNIWRAAGRRKTEGCASFAHSGTACGIVWRMHSGRPRIRGRGHRDRSSGLISTTEWETVAVRRARSKARSCGRRSAGSARERARRSL